MDPEYEDDEDGLEPSTEVPQPAGFDGLPPETQAEIRKMRKAEQKLREERGTLQKELLTAKYGDEVVDLIPPEVTDYARQTELAEKFQARLATSSSTGTQVEAEAEAEAEPPTEAEQQLATATGGPATGTSNVELEYTPADIMRIGRKDKARADEIVRQMEAAGVSFKREFGLPK